MQLLEMGEPSEAQVLRNRVDELQAQLAEARKHANEAVQDARQQAMAANRALAKLRQHLQPLYSALREVFGEVDAARIEVSGESPSASTSGPLDPARYAAWKEKYPGQTASAIDIL